MTPSANPRVALVPTKPGVEATTARISAFSGGVLAGVIGADDAGPPPGLLVAANGRTLGEAAILWEDAGQCSGTWWFDARGLPPAMLLEEHVSFEIKLTRRSEPLDSIEIEPSQFPSLHELPPARGALEGYVDGTEGGTVRGWTWDPTDAAKRVSLMLFVDGRFCGTYVADLWRHDIEASGRGDGRYGFCIQAQAFLTQAKATPSIQLVAAEPHLWHVPPAPRPRQRRFALPGRHDMPRTTRAFVAILAGTEPFPKKAYVIDRTVRAMPSPFSADYALLAIEYLRVEMLKAPAAEPASWRDRILAWWRQRLIRNQIRRLAALADAAAASQKLLDTAARGRSARSR